MWGGCVVIGDFIGVVFGVVMVLVLIGECLGLLVVDSLGVYLILNLCFGLCDSVCNCVLNIYLCGGLLYKVVVDWLVWLVVEVWCIGVIGVVLKDESG